MSNGYYTSPTDISAVTKALSADINTIDASVDTAFDKLPTEDNLKRGTVNYAVDTGIVNAYVIALPHTPSGYVDGLLIAFRPLNTNTSSATVNVSGLGVKSIRRDNGDLISAGDITAGSPISARYSTATGYFHISGNSAVNAAAAAASQAAAAVSESNAASSASAASASASAASGSASTASTQASNASTSASTASTQATNASNSASAASSSASTATTQASTATTQAGLAAASESAAASSASTATTQASNATTEAGNSATSATLSQNWAVSASIVAATDYSAKQWATKTTTTVDGVNYSAKQYAINAAASAASAAVLAANSLNSASTVVNVSSATAPTTGQVLMATGASAATWQTPSAGASAANPTGTISGTAVNGVATTFMRSDAAPALSATVNPVGLQTCWIPAGAMVARTTNGAASGTAEMSTNKNMFKTLDFDTATSEYAQFAIQMPKSWDEGTVTAAFCWSHASTTTNFGVTFALQAVAISNDDAGDVAFGTAQTATDTGGTTNDIYVSPTTSAITIAGTPAANDYVMFQVYRAVSDGGDTMAIDARLHGIQLFYSTDAATDA